MIAPQKSWGRFLIACIVFSLPIGCAKQIQHLSQATDTRIVTVCILNDTVAPADLNIVQTVMKEIAIEYYQHVGIALEIVTWATYAGDLGSWDLDQGILLRRICGETSDIRIVFSNQEISQADFEIFAKENADSSKEPSILGASSNSYFGYILVYETDRRFTENTMWSESKLLVVLRHEIGHLFYLDHTHNAKSFMYPSLFESEGLWTQGTRKQLLENKYIARWFPNF